MHVLALDTTTRGGSVALVDEHRVIEERVGDNSRSQAERLPGELIALAEAHGIPVAAVDLFAVASGPGSFTGLRIGIATVQGLALTTGRRIVAVSALEALAHCVSADRPAGTLVAAWMDARRHAVFAALYRVADAPPFSPDRLVEIAGPSADGADATLNQWAHEIDEADVVFAGDGALLYATVIEGRATAGWRIVEPPPLAGAIGRIAVARAARGETIDPSDVRPLWMYGGLTPKWHGTRSAEPSEIVPEGMSDWIIHSLTSAPEIDAILAVEEASFTNPWTREMYLAELENRGTSNIYFVSNADRVVIGFCSSWLVVDELHINNLAVLPSYRRAGVATALLRHMFHEGARLGAVRATLEVRRSNEPARLLYERFGFTVAGVRRGYYTKPAEDAIVLWREGLSGVHGWS